MQSKTPWFVVTACGLACVMLLSYREEPSVQLPLKLITVRDDNLAAPAPVFERLREMEREIAVLKRKSWSEHLDPQTHYRFKYYMGKTEDVDDRSHVEPFYLGHLLDTTKAKRRVYIDLGMRTFQSSLCYMLQSYPAQFDEMHAFECCFSTDGKAMNGLPPLKTAEVESCINQGNKYHAANYTAEGVVNMTKLIWAFVDTKDDVSSTPPKIALNRYLESLELTEDDFVVIKMDIEGMEYTVLKALLDEPRLSALVDELMVEVHYNHPEMAKFGWDVYFKEHSLADAHVLFQKARDAGIVVHPWP